MPTHTSLVRPLIESFSPPHDQIERKVYDVTGDYARDRGHENPDTVAKTGVHYLRYLRKAGLIPTKIVRSMVGGRSGPLKIHIAYRPYAGPFRDVRFKFVLTLKVLNKGHVKWGLSFDSATQTPRETETEYDIVGDAFSVGFQTPTYDLGGFKMPSMFLKTGDVDVRDRTFTGDPLTSRALHAKQQKLAGYYQMQNREIEHKYRTTQPGKPIPEFKPHPHNRDWVIKSYGRGRGKKADVYWANTGDYMYNDHGAWSRRNVGQEVSSSELAWWERNVHSSKG